MSQDFRRQEAEQLAGIRAHRNTVEIQGVLQWLRTLELQATEALIDCAAGEHADRAARVQILRLLQAKIAKPTLEESQARFKVTTDV